MNPDTLTATVPLPLPPRDWTRAWSRAEVLAWCQRTGRNPALFVVPEPPDPADLSADLDAEAAP